MTVAPPPPLRNIAIADPDRAGVVLPVLDVALVPIEKLEVLVVVLAFGLDVPQSGKRGQSFGQPLVAIGCLLHAAAPPLMRHLVRPEEFIEAVERGVLERGPGQIDHSGRTNSQSSDSGICACP